MLLCVSRVVVSLHSVCECCRVTDIRMVVVTRLPAGLSSCGRALRRRVAALCAVLSLLSVRRPSASTKRQLERRACSYVAELNLLALQPVTCEHTAYPFTKCTHPFRIRDFMVFDFV